MPVSQPFLAALFPDACGTWGGGGGRDICCHPAPSCMQILDQIFLFLALNRAGKPQCRDPNRPFKKILRFPCLHCFLFTRPTKSAATRARLTFLQFCLSACKGFPSDLLRASSVLTSHLHALRGKNTPDSHPRSYFSNSAPCIELARVTNNWRAWGNCWKNRLVLVSLNVNQNEA